MINKKPNKIIIQGKPKYVKIGDEYDFFQLFIKIEQNFKNCFLFESLGEESNISRYHIVGFNPKYIVYSEQKDQLIIEDTSNGKIEKYVCDNPYYELRTIIPQNIISRKYAGGLVGFIGYDSINFFEDNLNITKNNNFESFKFGVYLDGLIFDQMTGEIFYYYYEDNKIEILKDILKQTNKFNKNVDCKFIKNSMTKEDHRKAVLKIKEDIKNGLIFQCEVGFKSHYRIKGNLTEIYSKLRSLNPSPHMYFMKFDDQVIIGASPELLFRLKNGEMETFPLAGTTKRGSNKEEDLKLARELLNDSKEIAEHNMLVDLHRNDLGRVAKFGTVKVRNLMDIKKYSHVQHISSEIAGIINENEDMFSALASNFPAGTLSGAPKIEAMKIINEIEEDGRGPYGGAIGQFGFNGDCTFAIPIRSLFIKGEEAYAQTCGGNVYDSDPNKEYQEIERKLKAMKIVLKSFENKK
ncbi:anthranilate synthase component I family protein [Candidatus Levibacter sp. Uisw_134_01]|uniref:anthranilate synthase component I family protein n=1 Tax=Candidatus Levibacter sp. Uisw_134_01 TaxID=3230999 RepID=UPI003D45854D